MQPHLASACPFAYQLVQGERRTSIDDETVLSRYPVTHVEQRTLFPQFRRVLWTRIAHPGGTLDLYVTHLGSSSDGGPQPCGDDCPAECVAAGAVTIRDCQAVRRRADRSRRRSAGRRTTSACSSPSPASSFGLVAGDFNETPGSSIAGDSRPERSSCTGSSSIAAGFRLHDRTGGSGDVRRAHRRARARRFRYEHSTRVGRTGEQSGCVFR